MRVSIVVEVNDESYHIELAPELYTESALSGKTVSMYPEVAEVVHQACAKMLAAVKAGSV